MSGELFSVPVSRPDDLTAARAALKRAEDELARLDKFDSIEDQRSYRLAVDAVRVARTAVMEAERRRLAQ